MHNFLNNCIASPSQFLDALERRDGELWCYEIANSDKNDDADDWGYNLDSSVHDVRLFMKMCDVP